MYYECNEYREKFNKNDKDFYTKWKKIRNLLNIGIKLIINNYIDINLKLNKKKYHFKL